MAEDNQKTNAPQDQQLGKSATVIIPKSYEEFMQLFQPKTSVNKAWPSLVGLTAEEAEKKIKEEMAEVYVSVVPPSYAITFDLRSNRVWLFVDSSGKVVQTPVIG
ncbi:subtilisin inhibitor CLSI-I-like [Benincasa hispida]|uniref:subtilisin inhibitor CLSI-I-like n=1 Tax=Benincasa hispida TaxID=102211 RepID=UPI0019017939|nr:subtilisin inhibitor CLSI-I-like [Benincasa hispida]